MRKIYKLLPFLIVSILLNCKSLKVKNSEKEETKILVESIFNNLLEKDENIVINNKILDKINVSNINTYQELIQKSSLFLQMAVTFNAKSKEEKIDFSKIFTKKEIDHMNEQAANLKSKTWQDYINIKYRKPLKNNNKHLTYSYTKPVFTIDSNYALIYKEGNNGGNMFVYQKINKEWKPVAVSMVFVN